MQGQEITSVGPLNQTWRIVALFVNIAIAALLFFFVTGTWLPTGSGDSVWFLAAIAYWLLALIAAPFFLPPRDSLGTAIAAAAMLAPLDISAAIALQSELNWLRWVFVLVSIAASITAILAIAYQNRRELPISQISYRLSSAIGRGEVLFTPAVIISAVGFYSDVRSTLIILGFWTLFLAARPVELFLRIGIYLAKFGRTRVQATSVGVVLRIDDPGLVRVALTDKGEGWRPTAVYAVNLSDGKSVYVLPLFTQMQNDEVIGTGLYCEPATGVSCPSPEIGHVFAILKDGLAAQLSAELSGEENAAVVGIVVERSTIATVRFQVIRDTILEEGMVVFVKVRGKKVYFQILDANTSEELFHQHPHGIHIASAAQLGSYDPEKGFQKFPWLPDMNQPLFLASKEKVVPQILAKNEFLVGQVPHTHFGVPVVLDDLVEYHTAILGITGTGKTELSLDLIRNALDRETKVFCVDFTGEYIVRLADYKPSAIGLSIAEGSELEKLLFAVETGEFGAKKEKGALQVFIDKIKPQVAAQVEAFLSDKKQRLGIFELAEITNTKATLRITELYLSAIMNWARKHRRAQRIMIVLEEAHTIVPEAYGSGFDAETQWVVSRIGQIALQGRKYGVGLLVISQRTALVSKTILSQCNTYFTHALVDKTSLDYLSSVYSGEHVQAIPNLRFLEFIASGKAIKSERPLIAKRAYDAKKAADSRKIDETNKP